MSILTAEEMARYLILVGLLSICSFSFGQECRQELLENVDFPGTDITFVFSPDAEHCQRLCTQHSRCLYFTFVRADWTNDNRNFYCYLKTSPSGQPNAQNPVLGVTSGYSLKPCSPQPQPCLSRVYQNVDFQGADYRTLFTADYEACQRVCTQDPYCQFFTFTNGLFTTRNVRYLCRLKFSWTIPRTPIVEAATGISSGFSHKVQMTQSFYNTACQGKLLSSTDIPGSDIEVLPAASPQHCQALCSNHPRCTFFSFVGRGFSCHLKNNPNAMIIKATEGVTSGLPAHFCELNDDWVRVTLEGVNFRDSDIRFELTDDPDTCQRTCSVDYNCQFYAYVRKESSHGVYGGRCYLKRVITIPAPPKVTKLANVVSGFSLRDCV